MAEADLHADIFNSRYFGRETSPAPRGDREFSLFTWLPRELRLQIWTCHLPQRRFLRVLLEKNAGAQHGEESERELGDDDNEWAPVFAAGSENSGTSLSASRMAPRVRVAFLGDPSPAMPALRRTCREARAAHNSVYRVRFPALTVIPRGYDYTTSRIVAYLNPDLDMLSIQMPQPDVILNCLPLFLHHLVQHDFSPGPLRFGVRHLCVDLTRLSSDRYYSADQRVPASLDSDVLNSVRLAVSNLRGLYLRLTTGNHLEPRVMSGPFVNTSSCPWYNASVPILPAISWGFHDTMEPVPGGDPRLALPEGKADLHQVWIGHQLGPSLNVWASLKRAWGVSAGPSTVVRAVIGVDAEEWAEDRVAPGDTITSTSLGAYLREERAAWQSLMDPESDLGKISSDIFHGAQDKMIPRSPDPWPPAALAPGVWISRRQPHTAVGFWLVDPGVLEAAETTGFDGKKIVNLFEKVKPEDIELWVFRGHA